MKTKLLIVLFVIVFAPFFSIGQSVPQVGSVGKLLENNQIKISDAYPNPAKEHVFFDYKLSLHTKEAKITLKNMLARKVAEEILMLHDNRLEVPIGHLPMGIYFYTLSIDGHDLATKRIVVR